MHTVYCTLALSFSPALDCRYDADVDQYVVSEVVEKYIYGYPWHLPDGTIRYTCRSTFMGIGSSTNPKGLINERQILDVATVVWNDWRQRAEMFTQELVIVYQN